MANKTMRSIEARVTQLEIYFKIGVGIALILGVSGGWLGKVLYDTHSLATEAKTLATNAKGDLQQARDEAIGAVRSEAPAAVTAEVSRQVPAAIDDRVNGLVGKIRIVFGDEQFLDYKPLSGNFEHKCPAGSVVTSWGHGEAHNDVMMRCRSLSISR